MANGDDMVNEGAPVYEELEELRQRVDELTAEVENLKAEFDHHHFNDESNE